MAGKVKHLVQRGDGFWARIVVPEKLRPIIGKNELREPLGSSRKEAERKLHPAIARFHDRLAEAERQLSQTNVVAIGERRRPRALPVSGMARTHYAEELAIDERERDYPDRDLITDTSWARPAYADALRRVVAGRASNEEAAAVIGWAIDKFTARGNTRVEPGTAEWRELARTLAAVQLEALERVGERDRGDYTGKPAHPILAEESVSELPARVTLTELFDGYIRELKASGKGKEAERRWRPVISDLRAFLRHEDARQITKADIVRWKDARLASLAPKTIRDVHLAAVRAILQWAADNGHLRSNTAQGVKVRIGQRIVTREKGFTDTTRKPGLSGF